MLLAKDKKGYSLWHHAAYFGKLEALETLRSWAKKAELNPDELLLAQAEDGETVLHVAVKRNQVEILEILWVWAEEQLNTNELRKKLLLAKDKSGYTALEHAQFFWQVRGITDI